MNTLYEYSVVIFSQIDPSRKFSSFTYYDKKGFNDVNCFDCQKDTIIKIDNIFFLYKGIKNYCAFSKEKAASKIRFKNRSKILIEIQY